MKKCQKDFSQKIPFKWNTILEYGMQVNKENAEVMVLGKEEDITIIVE